MRLLLPVNAGHRTDVDGLLLDSFFISTAGIIYFRFPVTAETKYLRNICHTKTTADTGFMVYPDFFHLLLLFKAVF
jgi:hypothetical protein